MPDLWLNMFNTHLILERYWQGPKSQEVGEEGDCTLSPLEWFYIKMCRGDAAVKAILMFLSLLETKAQRLSVNNFWRERRAEAEWNQGPSAYRPNY